MMATLSDQAAWRAIMGFPPKYIGGNKIKPAYKVDTSGILLWFKRRKHIYEITASLKGEKKYPRVYLFTQQIFIQDLLRKRMGIYTAENKKGVMIAFCRIPMLVGELRHVILQLSTQL